MTVAVCLSALAWLAFVVWYTLRAKWWRLAVGWNTFGVSLVMFVVLLRLSVLRLHPGFEDPVPSGILVYSLTLVLAIQRIVFMENAQRKGVSGPSES